MPRDLLAASEPRDLLAGVDTAPTKSIVTRAVDAVKDFAAPSSSASVMDNPSLATQLSSPHAGLQFDQSGMPLSVATRGGVLDAVRIANESAAPKGGAPVDLMAKASKFIAGTEHLSPEQSWANSLEESKRVQDRLARENPADDTTDKQIARQQANYQKELHRATLTKLAATDTPEGVNARNILEREYAVSDERRAADERAVANAHPLTHDAAVSLREGMAKLPGSLTGILDMAYANSPMGIIAKRAGLDDGNGRPFDTLADKTGMATGIQPAKFRGVYSDTHNVQAREADKIWADDSKSILDTVKFYAKNPALTVGSIIQSTPQMLAGGAVSRGLKLAASGMSGFAAGSLGEGVVSAGSAMDSTDRHVDSQRAALAALATGITTAGISFGSGKLAQHLGIDDIDNVMAGGKFLREQSAGGLPLYKSLPLSMVQEGLIEEGAQSAFESVLKNWAEDKPLFDGMGRNVFEGVITGSAMGGGMSVAKAIAQPYKSPNPLSERAATESARQKTNVTGEPHEVVPHPEVAGKFAAVPTSSAAQGVSQPVSATAQSGEYDILSGGVGAPDMADVAVVQAEALAAQQKAAHEEALNLTADKLKGADAANHLDNFFAAHKAQASAMPSVEAAPAARIAAHVGHPSEIVMPDNTDLKAQWEVVDADQVTASLKEGISQPRDRSRAASNAQVQGIANNPDYRRLADSPMMDYGAPTLSQEGAIVGGNGRFEGVSRAYDNGTAAEYLARLKVDAQTKGIDPAIIDTMSKPVLVRRITQPFDTRALAVASNSGGSLQYSALEMAKLDGERMKHLSDIEVGEQGDIQLSGANMANVRRALTGYNAAELGSMTDKDGMLSQEGLRRLKGAMIYKAYGDSPMLTRLLESTDNDLRGVSGALMRAAGKVAKVRSDIESGVISAEFDIAADIVGAVEQLSKIKATGATVEAYLAQQSLLGAEISADATSILRFLSDNIRSQKRMAEFISSYYDALASEDYATGSMFSDIAPATKQERLNAAIKQNSRAEITTGNIARDEAGKQDGQQPAHESRVDGSNGESAGGGRFALAGQTQAEVKAQEQARLDADKAAQYDAQQARDVQAAKDQAAVDAKVKARTDNADNFQFGESSRDAAKPVADLFAQPSPMQGKFGTVFTQFYHNAKGAIAKLMQEKQGDAVGALHHPDVGDIDLVWGKAGKRESDGYGLSKIAAFHPEVLDDLQAIVESMRVVSRSDNRIQLESDTHKGAVRIEWDGESKNWLLTAFEKEEGVPDTRTDTVEFSSKDDTARLANALNSNIPPPSKESKPAHSRETFKLSEGDVLIRHDGVQTTPFPKIPNRVGSAQGITPLSKWLAENAIAKANDEGNDIKRNWAVRLLDRLNAPVAKAAKAKLSIADLEQLAFYLFKAHINATEDFAALPKNLRAPKVTVIASGKPFPSARLAQASINQRKLDAVPVAVEGGFGIKHSTQEEIDRAKADADMRDALADLGAIMRDVARVQRIIPENKPELMRVLVRLFDAAFRKGYYDLKDAARYVRKLMSEHEATKAGAQFIPEAMMNEAASKAASAMPEGFFDNQGLFGQSPQQEVSAEPAQAIMTNADKQRNPENFVPPPLHSFIDAKTLQDTHDTIAKYQHLLVNKEVVLDPDEVEFAKLAITPVLAKAEKNFAAFKEAVIDIAHESGIGQMVAPIKKMDRCVEKMLDLDPDNADYTTRDMFGRLEEVHAAKYLRDTLRATIVVQSYDDVPKAIAAIKARFQYMPERHKDRVAKPLATGYRDHLLNVMLPGGLQAEIQINTPEMLAAKDLGHDAYAIWRSTKNVAIKEETNSAQLELYGASFLATTKSKNSALLSIANGMSLDTTATPSRNTVYQNNLSVENFGAPPSDSPNKVPPGNSAGTGNLSGNLLISNSSKHTIAKNASDSKLEEKARAFAEHHHGAIDQRRKFTNEPYITHPAGVVEVLKTVAHTPEMVAAAWAHDTVEDTKATIEDVRRELGDTVASLVAELTKPAVAQSAEAQTIKLSDIIHNLSGLADADPVFAKRYAKEKAIQIGKLTEGDAALQARAKGIAAALEAGKFKEYDDRHETRPDSPSSNERKRPAAIRGADSEQPSGTVRGRLRGRNELSNNLPSLFDSRQTGDEQNRKPTGKDSDIQRSKSSGDGNHPVRNAGVPAGHDIPAKSGLNYHFTDEDLKGRASWLGNARQNVEAIELVKKLQSESRQATRAEQAMLAKFSGWGAADIRNNLFDPKLNAKLELMAKYHEAVAALGSKPYLTNAVYKEYLPAFTVLQSKSPTLSWYSTGNITRAMLDAAKPDIAVTNWGALRDRLKAVMSDDEWKTAERSTQYAHYTGKEIVNAMWGAMDRMGFKGGAILEPGAGTGVFAGLMNAAVANNSSYTGIEYDAFTGAILKQLQPDERILTESFIDSTLPDNFYDVAIGNPPFSDTKVLSDPRYKKHNFALHDYFFAKTIDKVKPGGLMMFVTSRHTMDKQGDKARQYLAERADLMGAIRLPQTAFKNAGTEVVTDIIFLRKKVAGEVYEGHKWLGLNEVKVKGGKHLVNEYFAAHPEMVLGEGALESGQFGQQYTVLPNKTEAIEAQLAKATGLLPSGAFNPQNGTAAKAAQVRELDFNPKAKKEGNYYVSDKGELMQVENRIGVPVTMRSKADQVMVADYVPLRDALNQAQYDQLNNGDWEVSLKHLHTAYKKFVAKHGNVLQNTVIERTTKEVDEDTGETLENTTLTRKFTLIDKLRDDFESSKLLGLETINDDTGEIKESPFFTQRTLLMRREAVINTPHDALLSSLNDIGAVDIPLIAKRIGLSESEVIAALGTSVYESPSQGWQMADEYLSGNVKQKLKEAQAAAKTSRRYERNVEALIAAQPSPVPPSDITASLGMNWIPTNIYEQVLLEKAGVKANITYNEHTGNWSVDPISGHGTVAATVDWGTNKRNAADIMEAGLTGRQIRITETVGSGADRKSVFDATGTEQAVQKLKELRTAFSEWLWQDGARTDKLVTLYNDKFNTSVSRQFNGAHLTLPGTTSTITVFDHVKRGAWRIIQTGNTYLAHAVGAGKTWAMVISAMEQKRLGLINKPMMVVPNHMLQQFAQEWLQLYPAARLMVADEKQFHTDNRRRFVSRVSMSDLDGVIITHSAFKLLDLDPDFKAKIIQEKLDNLESALTDIQAQEGESTNGKKSRNPKVRDIQSRIEKMEEKLKAVMSSEGKDKNVRFDEMGVDFLYVDEAHEYRKLEFTTLRQMKGINSVGSDRAADLQMKALWLEKKYPGRSLVLASGTPITNTMAEMYTVQRFMNPRALEEKGLQDFDAWASMFGEEQTEIEADASGKYAPVTRFSNMVNVPELTQMFREYADVLTSDHLGEMLGDHRPKVKGGARVMRVTPQVDAYLDFKQELADRLRVSREWKPSKDQPNNPDPVIRIIGDGRLAAIDMRFIDNTLPNDPASKLNQLAVGVIEAYKKGKDYEYKDKSGKVEAIKGSTQMVFSDLGFGAGVTEHRGFDARKWFERCLNSAGIPMSQIAFMSDYKKSADKAKLFKDMNAGRVRILVGSSKNMGTGVNAQQRLRVLHHLDTPWYPADLEQREGRIIRQGNKNRHVQIYAYSTKGSYDTNMWQLLARKQGFIDQAMSGDASVRRLEDISEVSQYQMATAMTAGNEDAIRLAGVSAELSRYDRLFRAHEEQRMKMKEGFALAGNTIAVSERLLPIAEKMADQVQDLSGDKFTAKVDKKSFDNRKEFGTELLGKFKVFSDNLKEGSEKLGEISGFSIEAVGNLSKGFKDAAMGYQVELEIRLGDDSVILARGANEDPVGVAIRANNALVMMARKPAELKQKIEDAKAKRSALESRMDSKFQFTAEYTAKKLEARELQEKLQADSLKVESKIVGDGTPAFSKREARSDLPPVSQSVIDGLVAGLNRVIGHTAGEASISVVFAVDELPEAILVQAATEKIPHDEILGVLHNGRAYIVRQNIKTKQEAEETLVHEVMGHGGVHALLGDARETILSESFQRAGGIGGLRAIAKRLGVLKEFDQRLPKTTQLSSAEKIAVVDELLALSQGKQDGLRQLALEWLGKMRNFIIVGLRKAGLYSIADKLDKFDATEAATMLRQMREAVIDGGDIGGHGVAFMVASLHNHNAFQQELAMPNPNGFEFTAETAMQKNNASCKTIKTAGAWCKMQFWSRVARLRTSQMCSKR
jgi:N12 class adenine-specific DNA methylase/predicted RNA methylase